MIPALPRFEVPRRLRTLVPGLAAAWPGLAVDPHAYAVIGMGALSASVIGAPLTMTFIALESTGNLTLTAAVLVAVVVAATRDALGYSFATWHFHLRGETIRSAADIGGMRDLTVGRMMRHAVRTAPADTPVSAFRDAFPLGSTARAVAVDNDGRYAGMVLLPETHAIDLDASTSIRRLLHHADHVLVSSMTIRTAVETFDVAEAEALAVVDGDAPRCRRSHRGARAAALFR